MEMPEEVNRILTDRISDLLFITERSGVDNLINEGIHQDKIHIVGNTMIDCLIKMKSEIDKNQILKEIGLKEKEFVVVTLHRPSNVDKINRLNHLIKKITNWSGDKKILWPMHPRIKKNELKIDKKKWYLSKPIGYIEFLKLVSKSFCVFTDSGGIQEETSFLGVECFTLRENTERPITCTNGTNVLLTSKLIKNNKFLPIKGSNIKKIPSIPLWDGRSSERILKIFLSKIKLRFRSKKMKLSIVTPGYNEGEKIYQNLEKIKTYLDDSFGDSWEVIFVNDGSSDNTMEILSDISKLDQKIKVISYKVNRGRGYALRQGIDHAKGKYILTMESDLNWGLEIIKKRY